MTVGERIKARRQELEMTQKELFILWMQVERL